MEKSKLVVIVPARAGSKGLKDKNLRMLNGESLISIAIRQAHILSENVILTTDIPEAKIVCPLPYTYYLRNDALSGDKANMIDVIIDVIENEGLEECEIVLMQPTTPLRCAELLTSFNSRNVEEDELLLTVCETDFNTLKSGTISHGQLVSHRDNEDFFANRQALPVTFKPNGALYKFHARDLLRAKSFNMKVLTPVIMSREESIDIDTLADIDRCKLLLER